MKKIIIMVVASIIVVASAIGIYFGLSNKGNVDLKVTIENVNVEIGEKEKVNFTVSEKSAVVNLSVENETFAEIIQENSNYYIKGLAAGQTKIIIKVSYGKYRNETTANLTVMSVEGENDNYTFNNLNDISYENKTFILTSGAGSFSITAEESYLISSQNVTCSNSDVSISQDTGMAGIVIHNISCSVPGTYQLAVNVNGIITNYALIVN